MLSLIYSNKHASNKGFTLIEMMVVVAIVAILAAIGIPMYQKYMDEAKTAEAVTAMGQIADATKAYYDTHGQYPSLFNIDIVSINGATMLENWMDGPIGIDGYGTHLISYLLPTLDISFSKDWAYLIISESSTDQFCIKAEPKKYYTGGNGAKGIYYINNLTLLTGADVKLLDGHFYKQEIFNGASFSTLDISGVHCFN